MFETPSKPVSFCSPGLSKLIISFYPDITLELIARLELQNKDAKVIATLAKSGAIDERLFLHFVSSSLGIRAVNLLDPNECNLSKIPFLLEELPENFATKHRFVPLAISEDEVFAAFADPLDWPAIQDLQLIMQRRVHVCLADEYSILKVLGHQAGSASAVNQSNRNQVEDSEDVCVEFIDGSSPSAEPNEKVARSAPVVRIVNKVLVDAVRSETSDIHFEPHEGGVDVKFRIDGVLTTKHKIEREMQSHSVSRLKLLSGMDITERRRPQDGRLSLKIPGAERPVDMRVSTVPTPFGEKVVIRLLSSNPASRSLVSLGLPNEMQGRIEEVLGGTDGIILVTGPTGSGKTTTLYTCLYHVLQSSRHVVTVEDPIEFRIPGVTQIQVDKKINMTFATGLRSILRQDPDVILLGEIRDLETAETAFHASQTGHLVMSTLHTNDAPSAVTRLRDLGLDPFIIASSIRGILAQRLVRKLCSACSRPLTPSESRTAISSLGISDTSSMRMPQGCKHCSSTGFRGRIGVYSFLPLVGAVKEAIHEEVSESELSDLARDYGFRTLAEVGTEHVLSGVSAADEISRVLGTSQSSHGRGDSDEISLNLGPSPKRSSYKSNRADIGPKLYQDSSRSDPNADESLSDLASESLLSLAHGKGGAESARRVLLVDDDVKIRTIMAQALRGNSFEVFEASNGEEALVVLESVSPSLVVCDLVMPKMDGRNFLTNLRAKGSYKDLPVLMLTSEEAEGLEEDLLSVGASDFIKKTSSIKQILGRIKTLVREKRYSKSELILE